MTNAASPMPKYRSHKEWRLRVWALKIGDGTINIHPDGSATLPIADGGFAPVTVAKEVVSRYMPVAGDYYVRYSDGYESISPGKAFEDGYTRI